MERRRVHGIIAHNDFNPRAIMEDEYAEFDKSIESIDTIVPDVQTPVGAGI